MVQKRGAFSLYQKNTGSKVLSEKMLASSLLNAG
jgi:hypothetical protein